MPRTISKLSSNGMCCICGEANSQVPRAPSQKLDVSHAGSLSRGFPSWKRAWSLVPDNPKPAFLILFFKTYLFLERREGRERNVNVWLPPMRPLPGKCSDWESNRQPTRNPWVHKPVLNPLSHTSQACSSVFVVIHPKADTWLAILHTGGTYESVFQILKDIGTMWSPSTGKLFLKFEE